MSEFFDYETTAANAGISSADLDALRARVRDDSPGDTMLFELRLLRTCDAIKEGWCTVAEALEPDHATDPASLTAPRPKLAPRTE